jgi:hypothetical protein
MDTNSPVYAQLNKAWKATCRILFGEEIGELKEYEEWLKEYLPPLKTVKSSISGKEVTLGLPYYCKDAHFIALDEVRERSIEPLTINEIKDIDSIAEAISEKWEYCGSKISGRSTYVDSSDTVVDSHYIADSFNIYKASYVFASGGIREDCKYIFGSVGLHNEMEFIIEGAGASFSKRCLNICSLDHCSDLYFSANCYGCSDLLFSFNLRNKRNMIGNLALSKEKYLTLKAKLIAEIRDELKKEKKLPSIFQFLSNKEPSEEAKSYIKEKVQEKPTNITPIEKAFSSTFKILFKKETSGIDRYERWLSKYAKGIKEVISPFGQPAYLYSLYEFEKVLEVIPENSIVNESEAFQLEKLSLSENEIQNWSMLKRNVEKIGFASWEAHVGTFENVIKCPLVINASNVYKCGAAVVSTEYVGMNRAAGPNAKYIFGSDRVYDSQFCISCYYSAGLTRCFEVDSSSNCSDTYFAHNCESLAEAMFCWNAKGKRYAIGNAQLPPDQYRKIKDMLVEQMANEILSKKELKYDIFNIGCGKK